MAKQPNPWFPKQIYDFWDVRSSAIRGNVERLRALTIEQQQAGLEEIERAVVEHSAVLTGSLLVDAVVSMVDSLFRTLTSDNKSRTVWDWDFALAAYLRAVSGTLLRVVNARGYLLRYVVNNTYSWPDMLVGPMLFYDYWFSAAGFVYICPQFTAAALMKADGYHEGLFTPLLPKYVEEGNHVALKLLDKACIVRANYVFVVADVAEAEGASEEALQKALEGAGQPGIIHVVRSEAPGAGSKILVSAPPRG